MFPSLWDLFFGANSNDDCNVNFLIELLTSGD
jgi:hypothetical protein